MHPLEATTSNNVKSNNNNTLTTPPLLFYPGFDLQFTHRLDASTKGLGEALYHYKDKVRTLGYRSRAAAKEEKKYHNSELEI